MKTIFVLTILLSLSILATAQQDEVSALSKTLGGQRVLAYFAAFNSGDETKLREFLTENIAPDSLKERPVEARLAFQRQVKSDFQTLEIKKILSASETEIKIAAQSKAGGAATVSFMFENQPPQKLLGVRIERGGPIEEKAGPERRTPLSKAEFLQNVEKYLGEQSTAGEFSGVVLIAEKNNPVFFKAYGLANQENKTPNHTDTKFNLGSINKTFTRIAIGQLIQQGKISFDDKLGKFLPDFPNREAAEKVTIGQLVTMKSGIGDFFGEKFISTPKGNFRKNSDFISLFADQPLAFEPGTREQYSNGGYILLGAIIEKVTGKDYYDYVRENVFKPVGMNNTDSFEMDKLPANTAIGYSKRNPANKLQDNAEMQPARGSSAGGGYSTAEDLLKFSLALQSSKLIIPSDNGQLKNEPQLGIAGGSPGVNSILIINGPTNYTIIVLSNFDPPSAEKVGRQLRDWQKQVSEK